MSCLGGARAQLLPASYAAATLSKLAIAREPQVRIAVKTRPVVAPPGHIGVPQWGGLGGGGVRTGYNC
jgi:hypothetical protein